MNPIIQTDSLFMTEALKEARYAYDEGEVPVGAIVICKGIIIAKAHNLTERLVDCTAHAEIQAITSAQNYLGGKYLDECTLYVTIEPCVMCAGATAWAKIGRIVFGAGDDKAGFLRFGEKLLHPSTQLTGGILEKECAELMVNFFRAKRK